MTRAAEHLARMVLGNQALLGSAGSVGAGAFLIDMNKAFESFVVARLARYLSGRLSGRLTVSPQHRDHLDLGGNVRIRPDLVFKRPAGDIVYVADTKYKITADGYGRDWRSGWGNSASPARRVPVCYFATVRFS